MEDIIRVLRLYAFEGPRTAVETQVRNSIHGTKNVVDLGGFNNGLKITAITLDPFPGVVVKSEELTKAFEAGVVSTIPVHQPPEPTWLSEPASIDWAQAPSTGESK